MKKNKHIVICSAVVVSMSLISLFAMLPLSRASKTSRGSDWMKNVDDSSKLTALSIPGSHDSGALHSIGDLSGKCQDLSISGQLEAGVRFFDIRLQQRDGDLKVVHGIVDQKLDFSSVLKDFASFLENHPSEGLIVSIKEESSAVNTNETFDESVKSALSEYSSVWNTDREIPESLGKLRGKVYLVSRYKGNSIGLPAYEGWIEHDKEATTNTFDIEMANLHVQDYFKIKDIENKQKEITGCLDYSANNPDKLTMNFSSCYYLDSFPPTYAATTAKIIKNWLPTKIQNRKNLGIIVSDFVTSDFAEAIYKRNF